MPRRQLRVLLVEDEPLVRIATAAMIEDLGYVVVAAGNAAEATAELEKQAFDVIVADLTLPGMPGDQLAARAVAAQPGLRVVFCSGHASLPAGADRPELAGAVFLQKPYGTAAMEKALETPLE